MRQDSKTSQTKTQSIPLKSKLANTYYSLLDLHPSASMLEIRRSYRTLSKTYHPDTTILPPELAKAKFQQLNEAYATLSSPEKRSLYDLKIGYSRLNVIQAPTEWEQSSQSKWSQTAYLDPTDRPLSSGEIFVLFILGLTFIGCLILVIAIAYLRGESF
ncbi:heat shock protein DnaJ domain protein [Stanieria sp. NIES-3757]|nr:heat shock protein DnaJ domain protein [Stanieria sp. NIES-3757]